MHTKRFIVWFLSSEIYDATVYSSGGVSHTAVIVCSANGRTERKTFRSKAARIEAIDWAVHKLGFGAKQVQSKRHWYRNLPEVGTIPACVQDWERRVEELSELMNRIAILRRHICDLDNKALQNARRQWTLNEIHTASKEDKR